MDIIWNPKEIEKRSMEIVEDYIKANSSFTTEEKQIVKRVIHASGDPDILEQMIFHPNAVEAGIRAIRARADIYVDVNMLKAGISPKLIKDRLNIFCSISDSDVEKNAEKWQISRAATSMRLNAEKLNNNIIAIGNAPTALFELMDLINQGIKPALIVGTPVGFVGAAESKEILSKQENVPFISLLGNRGGSAIAAAIINALLRLEGEN